MAARGSTIPLVTRKQLARVLGVTPRTIANLEAEEVLAPKRRGRGGRSSLYDLTVAVPAYVAHSTTGKVVAADKEARTRRDLAQAALTELKISRESGELLPRDEVVQQGQAYTKAWAASVRGLPRRLTQAGVIERAQEPAVAAACRDLLTDISSWKTMADVLAAQTQDDAA